MPPQSLLNSDRIVSSATALNEGGGGAPAIAVGVLVVGADVGLRSMKAGAVPPQSPQQSAANAPEPPSAQ